VSVVRFRPWPPSKQEVGVSWDDLLFASWAEGTAGRPSARTQNRQPMAREPPPLGGWTSVSGKLSHSRSRKEHPGLLPLAEDDPRVYLDYHWRSAVLRLGTLSATRRLVDLTTKGLLTGKSVDDLHWVRELGALISRFPEMRANVYELLKCSPSPEQGLACIRRRPNPGRGWSDCSYRIRKQGRALVSIVAVDPGRRYGTHTFRELERRLQRRASTCNGSAPEALGDDRKRSSRRSRRAFSECDRQAQRRIWCARNRTTPSRSGVRKTVADHHA